MLTILHVLDERSTLPLILDHDLESLDEGLSDEVHCSLPIKIRAHFKLI